MNPLEQAERAGMGKTPANDRSSSPMQDLQNALKILSPDADGGPLAGQQRSYQPGTMQDITSRAFQKHGVDPALGLALAESESSFNPNAVSPTGATGLFQFIDSTAKRYGVNRKDPVSSADGAARYIKDLLAETHGDVAKAIRLYKGVAQGGATEEDVQKTLGRVPKYRSGSGGESYGYTAPADDRSSTDVSTQTSGIPLDPNIPFGKPSESTASNADMGFFDRLVNDEHEKAVAEEQAKAAQPQPDDRSSNPQFRNIEQLARDLGIQPSHTSAKPPPGEFESKTQQPIQRGPDGMPIVAPNEDDAAISRGANRNLEPAGDFVRRVDESMSQSPVFNAMKAATDITAQGGASTRFVGDALNAALGSVPASLFPKSYDQFEKSTATGTPAADFLATQLGSIAGTMAAFTTGSAALDVAGVGVKGATKAAAIGAAMTAPSTAVRVAKGEIDPLTAIPEVALGAGEFAAFGKASELPNVGTRVAANVGASEASYLAHAGLEDQPVTAGGLVQAGGVGAAFGVLPGGSKEVKERVDTKAHEAATSPLNDRPDPTPAQVDAGNYKKGHVTVQGLDISIENPEGSIRSSKQLDENGKPTWQVQMKNHYGYIRGTEGADGDHVDTFLGPDLKSEKVFVIDQVGNASGEPHEQRMIDHPPPFDEHKVVLGARSQAEAIEIYKQNFSDNAMPRIGAVSEVAMPEFKEWLKKGDTTQPFNAEMRTEFRTTDRSSNDNEDTNGSGTPEAGTPAVGRRDAGTATVDEGPGRSAGPREEAPSGNAGPQAERSSEEATVASREPVTLRDTGHERALWTGDVKKPVKYALVEAADVVTSHDPFTFSKDERYPGENQNPYHSDKAQQAIVEKGGADIDWDRILNTTTTSTEGPTVIDPFGNAAGGNGRGMMQKIAYRLRPEESKQEVVSRAQMFGLDPEKANGMKEPMIVRVQQDPVSKSVESRRDIALQNQSVTKERTAAADGVDLAGRLDEKNKRQLAEALQDTRSIAELTDSAEKARPVIKLLREVGQITEANQNKYITESATLTTHGRETVEGMTLGLVVPDAALVTKLPDGFRQKLGENLKSLGTAESSAGWELHDNFARITDYLEARRAFVEKGGVKAMFDVQESLLPDTQRPPQLTGEDRFLLKLLEDPKRTKFRDFMQSYAMNADDARAGATDLTGEVMTRQRAFREAEQAIAPPSSSSRTSASMAEPTETASSKANPMTRRVIEAEGPKEAPPQPTSEPKFRTASAIQKTVEAMRDSKVRREVLSLFAPQRLAPEGRRTANIIRKELATAKRAYDIYVHAMSDAEAEIDRKIGRDGKTGGYDWIDRHERGAKQESDVLQNASDISRVQFEANWQAMAATGKLKGYIEQYAVHAWKRETPEQQRRVDDFQRVHALEGSKFFTRERIHRYFVDGINAGLEPVDPNVIRLQYWGHQQQQQFIMAHRWFAQEAAYGTPRYIPTWEPTPEGFAEIHDKIGHVFAPPVIEVREGFDRLMMAQLEQFADRVGIEHERRASLRGGKWGQAERGTGKIVTRFAGPESVLAHEIGHQLDWKFDLQKKFADLMPTELTRLANARMMEGGEYEVPNGLMGESQADKRTQKTGSSSAFKQYVHKPEEQMAAMFEAYVHAPELFKSIAPEAFTRLEKFLASNEETRSFMDIKPSLVLGERSQEVDVPGRREVGRWVFPESSAQVVNNFTGTSLRDISSIYRMVLQTNFHATAFRLGFSWFHGPFTMTNQIVTRFAASMFDVLHGNVRAGAKNFVAAMVAPVRDTYQGGQLGQEWRAPGTHPELAAKIDQMVAGGARDKIDSNIRYDAMKRWRVAVRQRDALGVAKASPTAIMQTVMYPIMQKLVPAAKHTSRTVIGEAMTRALPPEASIEEKIAALARADDYTDAIFGQVTYANTFMNNKIKDVLFGMVQSLGWNKGSYRLFTGASKDALLMVPRLARGKNPVTFPMAYMTSLLTVNAGMAGLITLATTGQLPDETKDWFYPVVGHNADGSKRRIMLPTYIGVLAGIGYGGVEQILHATAFVPQMIEQLWRNRTYSDEKIYNSTGSFLKDVTNPAVWRDVGGHLGRESFYPYSYKNFKRELDEGAPIAERMLPLIGVKPLPFYLSRTPAENLAARYMAEERPSGGFDPSQTERFQARRDLRRGLRENWVTGLEQVKQAEREGLVKSGASERSLLRSAKRSWLRDVYDHFSFDQAANIYESSDEKERGELAKALTHKYRTELKTERNTEVRKGIRDRYAKVTGQPVESAGTPQRSFELR